MPLILIVITVVVTRQISIKLRAVAARRALRVCHEQELTAYLWSIENKQRKEIAESKAIRAEAEWVESMAWQSFRN